MNVVTPDIRFFRYFEALATCDNPETAIESLNVSFRDARRDVFVLEDKLLKMRLFERKTVAARSRNIVRTAAGDEFLPRVRTLLRRTRDALRAIGDSSDDALTRLSYLDLRHFDRFAKLVDAGSLASSARSSGRHAERINADLTQFEDLYLHARLFERPRRPLRLTNEGRALLPHAKKIAAALADAFNAVCAALPGETVLHIGLASTPSSEFYPPAKQRFKVLHPNCLIPPELHDSTDNLIQRIKSASIDLAFVIEPLPPRTDLRYQRIYECVVCCALSWTHRLAGRKTLTLEQIAKEQFIAYSAKTYPQYHRYLKKFFQGRMPTIVAECEDHRRLIEHVERSKKRVALVPLQMDSHTEGRIALIPIRPTIRVGVGALSLKSLSPVARDFLRIAKTCVSRRMQSRRL